MRCFLVGEALSVPDARMGKYNRAVYTVITVTRVVAEKLKALRRKGKESINSVIEDLLHQRDALTWSVVRPVAREDREFWESPLFG